MKSLLYSLLVLCANAFPLGSIRSTNRLFNRLPSSSLSSSITNTNIDKHDTVYAPDNTLQLLRDELKSRLLAAADELKTITVTAQQSTANIQQVEVNAREQEKIDQQRGYVSKELECRLLTAADELKSITVTDRQSTANSQQVEVNAREQEKIDQRRGYVAKLMLSMVHKILRRRRRQPPSEPPSDQSSSIVLSTSYCQMLGAARGRVWNLCEQLALLNPTHIPIRGFLNYGGALPSDSRLGGKWKLIYTTAEDTSFSEDKDRGMVNTSQIIDADHGTFTNVVNFEKGKLQGFRVVVQGEPTNDTDIRLSFKGIKILRRSRFPRLFGQFTFRLPSGLLRHITSSSEGSLVTLRYLDDSMRIHVSDSGNYFVHVKSI